MTLSEGKQFTITTDQFFKLTIAPSLPSSWDMLSKKY
jgi:hypothetical protein